MPRYTPATGKEASSPMAGFANSPSDHEVTGLRTRRKQPADEFLHGPFQQRAVGLDDIGVVGMREIDKFLANAALRLIRRRVEDLPAQFIRDRVVLLSVQHHQGTIDANDVLDGSIALGGKQLLRQ